MTNMFIGLTDFDWYTLLKDKNYDEVNFWRPGSKAFRALQPNDLFLFKLKKPYYSIVGGGFFVKYSSVPIPIAWEAFGEKNGTSNLEEFSERLRKYREKNNIDINYPSVGCIVLTEPFFFEKSEWILPPYDWPYNAVGGKIMDSDVGEGKRIYNQLMERLQIRVNTKPVIDYESEYDPDFRVGISKHRLGQGAFRLLVTDTYHRRCAISGEKTLPVLQAAHIKPFARNGPHLVQNGILLRSDIHRLFDEGYITVSPDYHVEVSHRLKNDFGNGRIYYQYHGKELIVLPNHKNEMPAKHFLNWHNGNVYLG